MLRVQSQCVADERSEQSLEISLAAFLPWCVFRLIDGTNMIEVDVYWFYWLSAALNPLTLIPPVTLSSLGGQFATARAALSACLESDHSIAFPKTAERMRELLAMVDVLFPPNPGLFRDRRITDFECNRFKEGVTALSVTLQEEGRHNYVLCIQDQRCLSAYSLVEKIQSCFSPSTWNMIDKTAKREFAEAGRCLALERYTGAGFHSLRGVECVIRQFIVDLTGDVPGKRDWGHYTEVLKNGGADLGLIAVLNDIRTRERNPLMHPEAWLDIDDAIALFTISQAAIARLAAEMRRKTPAKYPVTAELA